MYETYLSKDSVKIKSNLTIDVEDIKDTAEYKGYLWRIDAKDDDNSPRNFRTSKDKFKKASDKYGIDVNYVPIREGLDELQASVKVVPLFVVLSGSDLLQFPPEFIGV